MNVIEKGVKIVELGKFILKVTVKI